jgi:putative hydrolase of the HAD superfamily
MTRARQHLIIDADDTLWENNIYFELAFDQFVDFLNHSALSPGEVRGVLDEIELVNSKIHGYGSANFARNMQECYHRLSERDIQHTDLDTIMGFAERILHHPMELIAGVEETLEYLGKCHELTLFTKGHRDEQLLKLERSGLGRYFDHVAVVKEKDLNSYSALISERVMQREVSWMVGNSPKSDINPALAAGINAIYVPHERTWHLERTDLAEGPGRLLILDRFADLTKHF